MYVSIVATVACWVATVFVVGGLLQAYTAIPIYAADTRDLNDVHMTHGTRVLDRSAIIGIVPRAIDALLEIKRMDIKMTPNGVVMGQHIDLEKVLPEHQHLIKTMTEQGMAVKVARKQYSTICEHFSVHAELHGKLKRTLENAPSTPMDRSAIELLESDLADLVGVRNGWIERVWRDVKVTVSGDGAVVEQKRISEPLLDFSQRVSPADTAKIEELNTQIRDKKDDIAKAEAILTERADSAPAPDVLAEHKLAALQIVATELSELLSTMKESDIYQNHAKVLEEQTTRVAEILALFPGDVAESKDAGAAVENNVESKATLDVEQMHRDLFSVLQQMSKQGGLLQFNPIPPILAKAVNGLRDSLPVHAQHVASHFSDGLRVDRFMSHRVDSYTRIATLLSLVGTLNGHVQRMANEIRRNHSFLGVPAWGYREKFLFGLEDNLEVFEDMVGELVGTDGSGANKDELAHHQAIVAAASAVLDQVISPDVDGGVETNFQVFARTLMPYINEEYSIVDLARSAAKLEKDLASLATLSGLFRRESGETGHEEDFRPLLFDILPEVEFNSTQKAKTKFMEDLQAL